MGDIVRRPHDYVEPSSVEEAERAQLENANAVREIESQLNLRKSDFMEGRMPAREYYAWRNSAVHAINKKRQVLALAKQWLKSHYRGEEKAGPPPGAPDPLDDSRKAFARLWDHVRRVEARLAEAEGLNAKLAARLAKYEPAGPGGEE